MGPATASAVAAAAAIMPAMAPWIAAVLGSPTTRAPTTTAAPPNNPPPAPMARPPRPGARPPGGAPAGRSGGGPRGPGPAEKRGGRLRRTGLLPRITETVLPRPADSAGNAPATAATATAIGIDRTVSPGGSA